MFGTVGAKITCRFSHSSTVQPFFKNGDKTAPRETLYGRSVLRELLAIPTAHFSGTVDPYLNSFAYKLFINGAGVH